MKFYRLFLYAGCFTTTVLVVETSAQAAPDGKAVFEARCAACHGSGGVGQPGFAPRLIKSTVLQKLGTDAKSYVVSVLVKGLSGRIMADGKPLLSAMPPQDAIPPAEIAAVSSYLFASNGLRGAPTPADFVAGRQQRASLPDAISLRKRVVP